MQEVKIENIVKVSSNEIYAGKHWTARKKLKDSYLWLTVGPFKKLNPVREKVDLDFKFYWGSRALDSSNCSYLCKVLEDCLVHHKILQDDTIKFVGKVSMESFKSNSKDQDYCVLTIIDKKI